MSDNQEERQSKQVSVRVSNEMYEALSTRAKKMGDLHISNLIKMAIKDWLVKQERGESGDKESCSNNLNDLTM